MKKKEIHAELYFKVHIQHLNSERPQELCNICSFFVCANYIGHKYHGNSTITNKVLFLYFGDLSNQQLTVSGLDYLHNNNSNQGNTNLRKLTVLTLLLTTIEPTKKKISKKVYKLQESYYQNYDLNIAENMHESEEYTTETRNV